MTTRARYLTTLPLDDEWLHELSQRCPGLDIRRVIAEDATDVPDSVWAEIDILHTSAVFPVPSKAPSLRWIQLDTSGVEHLSGESVWNDGDVTVTTLGGIAPVPMAEFTALSTLALAHHQPMLDRLRRQRSWPDPAERLATLTPLPVDGATATIVGYGRIGREIARTLQAFGLEVIGVSRRGPSRADTAPQYDTGRGTLDHASVEHVSTDRLPEVLPRTDYLVVVVPRTAETTGLVGVEQFALLKAGACLVNVSRGGVVDEPSLLRALRSGRVRYAALDVFDEEPLGAESPWWEEPNTMVSPHVAGLAPRYREQVLELVSTNVLRYLSGQPLLNRADHASGY